MATRARFRRERYGVGHTSLANKSADTPVWTGVTHHANGDRQMTDRDEKEFSGAANINRRGLLKCMAWAGTGVVWTLSGGVPRTLGLIGDAAAGEAPKGELTFVQISDSHIGFHLPPNPDPRATLAEAIDKIKAMPTQPAFLIHTGDISHLSKEEEWDTADQVIKSANKQTPHRTERVGLRGARADIACS